MITQQSSDLRVKVPTLDNFRDFPDTPEQIERETALSDFQKGLYFVQRMAPDTSAYNLVFAARIVSELNVDAFRDCLQQLIDRHGALRTAFSESSAGQPRQYFHGAVPADFAVVAANSQSDAEIYEDMLTESRRPFDLGAPPLLRVRLYQRGPSEHLLLLTAHHIAVDFWSLAALLQELRTLYSSAMRGETGGLPKIPAGYADFVAYQQRMLDGPEGAKLSRYWQDKLAGELPTLHFPNAHPRPPFQTYRGASHGFRLAPGSTQKLKDLARSEGATLYMVLLAAYQTLLFRYTAQEDILVGSPASVRARPEWRAVVGNFTNLLPMRAKLQGNKPFRDLLRESRATVIEAIRHQDFSFARLVELLAPVRDSSHSPLVQACFAWERLPQVHELAQFFSAGGDNTPRIQYGHLDLEPYVLPQQEGQFDLALEMGDESDGELTGIFKYNTDLFDAEAIAAMSDHFVTLIDGLAADPDQVLSRLPLLTAAERDRLLVQWNRTEADFQAPNSVAALIEAQVLRTPDAPAITAGAHSLSYAELNRHANRLAHALIAQGIEPGDRVGIFMERNVDLPVALLGVLKSGACYIPLDPGYPRKRLEAVLEDAKPKLVLTHAAVAGQAVLEQVRSVFVDRYRDEADSRDPGNPLVRGDSGSPAYIIFTSGSTGRPKGVQVPHRAVVNFLKSMAREPGISADDVLLSVTTLSFDIAVLEIFLPLTVGARTVLADRETTTDPVRLQEALHQHRATLMQATPATWKMLVTAGFKPDRGLTMLTGGEALPRGLANALLESGNVLWNMYGPTETTVWSTIQKVAPGEDEPSLGRPIANTRLYVLDGNRQPVPVGVQGELYIAGEGVALGYFEQPDLTAEQFVCIPELEPDGQRLYRTGDRVRYRPNGELEYLGRFGNQVKLRGFRIDLGDIEANLRQHPEVNDAVVVVQETNGEKSLAAFCQPRPGYTPTGRELRQFIADRVPAYMTPAFVTLVDQYPLTPNGKIDRLALQKQRPDTIELSEDYRAPRSAAEMALVRIWEVLLGTHPIGIADNFFDLGGHSLLAVQMIAEVKQRFGVEIPLTAFLQNATVEAMAEVLRRGGQGEEESPVVTLRPDGRQSPLFLLHPIGGTVFCYLALSRHAELDRPIHAIQATGLAQADATIVSIDEMASQYVALIRERQPHGPYHLGGWCFGGVVAFEAAQQLTAAGEQVALLGLFDTRAPIPENAPVDGDDVMLLSWFARDLAVPYNKTLHILPEQLRELDADDMFDYVLDRANEIGVLPASTDPNLLRRYFEVYLANGAALQMYEASAYAGRTVLFLAADEEADYGPDLGWGRLLPRTPEIVPIPGNHNSLMYEPNVQHLADALRLTIAPAAD
jgi:amino acid adenylation domain-containing protein